MKSHFWGIAIAGIVMIVAIVAVVMVKKRENVM